MRRIHILLAIIALLTALQATAQTVVWQLQPTDYTEMVRYGQGLYQVTGADGKVGLIRPDGSVVVPVEADKIGQFYEHLALVTIDESPSQQRVLGVLTEDGAYTAFKEKYYTLRGQEFFSDGLLSVQNAKGKKGYVDQGGVPACGFDRNYIRIKPFTEGYAAVSVSQGKYSLIDKSGRELPLMLPVVGSRLVAVYNPIQGKALGLDDRKDCYKFTLPSGACEDMHQRATQIPTTDYLFRPEEVVKATGQKLYKTAPFTSLPEGVAGLEPKQMDGGYGFEEGGHIILPGQLASATPFEDDLSVVTIGGRTGLLRYYAGQQPFSATPAQELYRFDAGGKVVCGFALGMPQAWGGKQLSVTLRDSGSGETLQPRADAQGYTIELQPQRSGRKEYAVTVAAEGLRLWTGQLAFQLKRNAVPLQLATLQLDDNITDSNYRVTGSFTISNPNEDEVETELNFTHSAQVTTVGGFPQKLTLKPGEQRRVTFFIVTSNKRGTWEHTLTVNASKGGSATLTAEVETF